MHGLFNGMELMLATVEDREPIYKDPPDEWLCDLEVTTDPEGTVSCDGEKNTQG
jgi:hypothetical protein